MIFNIHYKCISKFRKKIPINKENILAIGWTNFISQHFINELIFYAFLEGNKSCMHTTRPNWKYFCILILHLNANKLQKNASVSIIYHSKSFHKWGSDIKFTKNNYVAVPKLNRVSNLNHFFNRPPKMTDIFYLYLSFSQCH